MAPALSGVITWERDICRSVFCMAMLLVLIITYVTELLLQICLISFTIPAQMAYWLLYILVLPVPDRCTPQICMCMQHMP